jgi:hypothetical protein
MSRQVKTKEDKVGYYDFVKLYSTTLYSTIWRESMGVRLVWMTLLMLADPKGRVLMTMEALAAIARVPEQETKEAIEKFLSPDPGSGSKEFEGRRLKEILRGWHILNYDKYRGLRDPSLRREYLRIKKQESRERLRKPPRQF